MHDILSGKIPAAKRRRHRNAYAFVVPTTGVVAMLALVAAMLVITFTDFELTFSGDTADGPQAMAVEDGN
jgi:hypothetical protein